MAVKYSRVKSSLLIAVAFSTFSLASCNFESDRDYKSEEKDGAGDTTQQGDLHHDQHNPTLPAQDAVEKTDSTAPTAPSPTGAATPNENRPSATAGSGVDSSIREDSGSATRRSGRTKTTPKKPGSANRQ